MPGCWTRDVSASALVAGLMAVRAGTTAAALATAHKDEHTRDAALVTCLVTLSGLTVAGIGAAFWDVAAGTVALLVQQYRLR